MSQSPEIAVIGGGTGSFTLLQFLKEITPNITAIVNMSDDGGSTGILRDELGVLPPGDVRQCLVALSNAPEMRDIFTYRFPARADKQQPGLGNHTLGNLILSGLELKHGSFQQALEVASRILNITGRVLPASFDNHTLVMHDGEEQIRGEKRVSEHTIVTPDATLTLDPNADANPEAVVAIKRADQIVIAPGNLYGSLLPVFAVKGIADAVQESRAQKVMIANLVTRPGQTDGWHVADYVKQFERYLGQDTIDAVLYNNEPPAPELLERYAADGELPVGTDPDRFSEVRAEAVGCKLIADSVGKQDPNDTLIQRTLIRHDGQLVAQALQKLLA